MQPQFTKIYSTCSRIRTWNLNGGLRWSSLEEAVNVLLVVFGALLMSDGVLNVTLPEGLFATGFTQGSP